ncbi:MAG: hypothetical protein JWO78_1620 [Micavibrio sp.]|nr:hypothetical protein [Micavibrio sp.]
MKQASIALLGIILLTASAGVARADSSCWPERKLIGTTAVGIYRPDTGREFELVQKDGSLPHKISCSRIVMNGSCDGEYSFIPVWAFDRDHNTVKIKLYNGGFAYLKTAQQGGTYQDILHPAGAVSPDDTIVFKAPALNAGRVLADRDAVEKFLSAEFPGQDITLEDHLGIGDLSRTYETRSTLHNNQGQWLEVDERLFRFTGEGPDMRKSDVVRTGYILHKTRSGIIKAVLEEEWCD